MNSKPTPHTSIPVSILGCVAVFASAFLFYLSTAVIRLSRADTHIEAAYFVFARFILGFIVTAIVFITTKTRPVPRNYHLLFGRTITNCIAVFCFYKAVELTSVAEANILNMTYPIFIALFSWAFIRSQRDIISFFSVFIAFFGIYLILSPDSFGINIHNLWGLGSGITASLAIIYLNISRQYHDTNTILFYMFGVGSLIIFVLFYDSFFLPDTVALYYLVLCAASGIAGQFLLTVGFRYVTAVEGGIISSTRIVLAAILGPVFLSEPPLSIYGWIGALLIFLVNVVLAVRKI